jgi:hypothetical protein
MAHLAKPCRSLSQRITLSGARNYARADGYSNPVIITVNLDANTARRNTTVWLVSEVGNKLIAGTPQLVVANRPLWRIPGLLTSSKIGTVGRVGTVDVDTITGKLLVINDKIFNTFPAKSKTMPKLLSVSHIPQANPPQAAQS